MKKLEIGLHALAGWADFKSKAGFVPDPMFLRTGEIFLNGARQLRPLATMIW